MGYNFSLFGRNVHQGSWLGLPDLGITERAPQVIQNRIGAPIAQPRPYTPPPTQNITPMYSQPAGPNIPSGGYNPATNRNVPSSPVQPSYDQGIQNIQQQANDAFDLINQDYENAMGMIGSQEQSTRSDAAYAQGQAEASGAKLKQSYADQAATQTEGVNSQLSTAEKQGTSAIQQARDVFRQTQQNNIAQLSALGISSSSVSEALAERLGVETARRIAGVTGSVDEVRQNAVKELGNIKNFVAKKNTEIDQEVENQKKNISRQMLNALDTLNNQRNVAATEKSRGRAGILAQVQNNMYSLTQQAQQYKQQLEQWSKQQSQSVYTSVGDLERSISSNTNMANNKWAPTGFQYAPEFSTNAAGNIQGPVKYTLQKKKDDQSGMPDFSTYPNDGFTY